MNRAAPALGQFERALVVPTGLGGVTARAAALVGDEDLKAAIDILSDEQKYRAVLAQ